jgi:hypothetical protein
MIRRKDEEKREERRASSHELREGRRGSVETVRKVQSEVNVRGEKLLPGRRLATAQPRQQ